jgi:REP element-mobilizing transposase RayT
LWVRLQPDRAKVISRTSNLLADVGTDILGISRRDPTTMPYNALLRGRCSREGCTYLITTATAGRRPLFASFGLAALAASELWQMECGGRWRLHAWVLMPDHVHLLIELRLGYLADAVRLFKGRVARRANVTRRHEGVLWQRGYHEHAVRHDEDLPAIARYVIANPVRAGLVRRVGDYPFWNASWL